MVRVGDVLAQGPGFRAVVVPIIAAPLPALPAIPIAVRRAELQGTRRKPGRKPPAGGPLVGTHVRLSAYDRERLKSEASAQGTTVSQLVRQRACPWSA